MSSFSKKFTKYKRGFSLIELMVVLAIFAIMTGVLISDIPNFRAKSSLDLTVSEVATYIRGAQVYGAAQKGATTAPVSYGIHFDKDSSSFYLFKNGPSRSIEETYELKGFKISKILVKYGGVDLAAGITIPDTYGCNLYRFETTYQANTYTQSIGTNLEATFEAWTQYNQQTIDGYDYADIMVSDLKNTVEGCLRIFRNGQIANISCSGSNDSFDNSQCTP